MIKKLKIKLVKNDRSFAWFCKSYLPDKSYGTIMQQINGFSNLQPEVEQAIKKYLSE